MLLIKPPHAKGALKVDRHPAQLIDVVPTMYKMARIDDTVEIGSGPGIDVFSNHDMERERTIFTYAMSGSKSTGLHRMKYKSDNTWHVERDIVSW